MYSDIAASYNDIRNQPHTDLSYPNLEVRIND